MATKKFKTPVGLEQQNIDFVSPNETKKITANMSNDSQLTFSGSTGQLFAIDDVDSGVIFQANDISGIPSIEVFDTGIIRLAETEGRVLISTATDNGTDKLQVNGGVLASVLRSNVATGTQPLTVSSTTVVSNLNADMVDGMHASTAATINTLVTRDANAVSYLGGLVIDGQVNPTASDYAGFRSAGTNLILKGNSTGISGIFFQSEQDGANINHPSDYGYIQYHPHGIDGTSGEANRMVIGVANDSNDFLVLQSPYKNGVKISFLDTTGGTTTATEHTVWHAGNHGATSGLDADLLDGQHGSYYQPAQNAITTSNIAAQSVATAVSLTTARNITLTGDVSWTSTFNGTADATGQASLQNTGVVAGTYNTSTSIVPYTVDSKGRITSTGAPITIAPEWNSITSKPTTISGFGITDAVSSQSTGLGLVGNVAYDATTNSAAEWAALPVGYSRMFGTDGIRGVGGTLEGAPENGFGFFHKLANRDTAGGWAGLWQSFSQPGKVWIGSTATSSTTATWYPIWTSESDGASSGLDADLLDGQHGSYYQPALVSGTNIKTINGQTILGSGDLTVTATGGITADDALALSIALG